MEPDNETKRAGSTGPLFDRTMDYALSIIKLHAVLPRTAVVDVISRQMVRSGTSVGAQYREACRARSRAEFTSKVESSLQELEETGYWLDLLERSGLVSSSLLAPMQAATLEIKKMMIASVNTAKRGLTGRRNDRK
jgi:four helix bundle protein